MKLNKNYNLFLFLVLLSIICFNFYLNKKFKDFQATLNNIQATLNNIYDNLNKGSSQSFDKINFDTYKKILSNEQGYILFFRHTHRDKWINVQMYDSYEVSNFEFAENEDYSSATCLSDKGKIQAKMMGKVIKQINLNYEKIFTSPSCRARQTAQYITGYREENIIKDPRLIPRGVFNENDDKHAEDVKNFLLKLKDNKNILVFAHNSVVKPEMFDNYKNRLYPYQGLNEGGFYVILAQDKKLNLIHAYKDFKDFSKHYYQKPEKNITNN